MPQLRHIVLIGPMAAGKSTVGKKLARRLDMDFHDIDAMIETEHKRTIEQIFASDGEAQFRRYETEALERACAAAPAVLSTGGGAVLSEHNRETLKAAGDVVYLRVGIETQLQRAASDAQQRPLLAGDETARRATLEKLRCERAPLYESAADHTLDADDDAPDALVDRIASLVSSAS